MADVVIENVCKTYPGGFQAVKNLDLHIRDQEFIVLVGPSGCGKSTTLRMVAGLEEITSGTMRIGDKVINHVAPKDRDIAMVFQNYALYPHMTVYKNMAFGLKLRNMPKKEIDDRVRWAAGILGLADLLDRKPKALSGGQRQRVAVGRAIVRQPKAFLFDEPLSNLDAKLRVETRAQLKSLHKRLMTTTIYVTHDQEEAMTLGDRVVVMDGGLLQQCDTPLTIYQKPVNRFVAGFLGTPPMNFMEGKLEYDGHAIHFACPGVKIQLTDKQRDSVKDQIGKPVALGIRPEAMSLKHQAEAYSQGQSIDLKISVTEPLGSHMDVYGHTPNETRLVARILADANVLNAQSLRFYLDMRHVHVFEHGTHGRNLTLAAIG